MSSATNVPQIELRDDGSIAVTVELQGFEAGTRVEISGQAIQPNGGLATFYDIQDLTAANPDGSYTLTVTATPLQKFSADQNVITTLSRAARIWETTLPRDPQPGEGIEALWKAEPWAPATPL
jgi:hypothetical protein